MNNQRTNYSYDEYRFSDYINRKAIMDAGFSKSLLETRLVNKDGFLTKLKEQEEIVFQADLTDITGSVALELPDIHITLSTGGNCTLYCKKDIKFLSAFVNKYKRFLGSKSDDEIRIVYLSTSKGELSSRIIDINLDDFPIAYPELYPDIYVNLLNTTFQESDESILILYGMPGVGKTMFIKQVLKSGLYKSAAYVKDIKTMLSCEFWGELSIGDYDLIILDDLDFNLSSRTEGSSSEFISNLLTFSDGIFVNRTKILITTNQPVEHIDTALIRPGRCFDFITLEPLAASHALDFWTNTLGHTSEEFDSLYGNSKTVEQARIMRDHKRLSKAETCRPYLKNVARQNMSLERNLAENGVAIGTEKISVI